MDRDGIADLRIRENLILEERAKKVAVDFSVRKLTSELTGYMLMLQGPLMVTNFMIPTLLFFRLVMRFAHPVRERMGTTSRQQSN